MKLFPRLIFAMAAAAILPAQDASQGQGEGSIEGSVINEVTREPVGKAQVVLAPANLTAVTDEGGRFAFRKLAGGTYYLRAMHAEFPVLASGFTAAHPIAVTLLDGEQKSGVVIQLTPGASISGRIVDEDGRPLAGCHAQALQPAPGQPGKLYPVRGSSADGRGQYRIYGLARGHYYIVAQCSDTIPASHPSGRYAMEFYPDTLELSGAMRLMAPAGASVEAIDFRMHRTATVTVRGRVTSDAELLGRNPHVELAPRETALANLARYGGTVDSQTGAFHLDGVPAGSYTLVASAEEAGRTYQAKTSVDIGDAAPDPLDLPLLPGSAFSGTIEIESDREKPPLENLRVRLVSLDAESFGLSHDAKVEKDGAFLLTNVLPGRWRVHVEGINGYVKSLAVANQQLRSSAFSVVAGAGGPMRVVVSTQTAQVEGTVSGLSPEAAAGVNVILTPDDADVMDLRQFIAASVGNDGRFRAFGIEPGRYRLYAVPAAVVGALAQHQPVLQALEGRSAKVELEAGSRAAVQLQPITTEEVAQALQDVE